MESLRSNLSRVHLNFHVLGTPNPVDDKFISDYHGLIHPHKLFPIDTAVQTTRLDNVQLHSLGFKVRRKRFLIEEFTLPPEDEDPTDPNQEKNKSSASKAAAGCGPRSNKIDF